MINGSGRFTLKTRGGPADKTAAVGSGGPCGRGASPAVQLPPSVPTVRFLHQQTCTLNSLSCSTPQMKAEFSFLGGTLATMTRDESQPYIMTQGELPAGSCPRRAVAGADSCVLPIFVVRDVRVASAFERGLVSPDPRDP